MKHLVFNFTVRALCARYNAPAKITPRSTLRGQRAGQDSLWLGEKRQLRVNYERARRSLQQQSDSTENDID